MPFPRNESDNWRPGLDHYQDAAILFERAYTACLKDLRYCFFLLKPLSVTFILAFMPRPFQNNMAITHFLTKPRQKEPARGWLFR
jgi:hypothetical protein